MRSAQIVVRTALALCCLGLFSCSVLVSGDAFIGDAPRDCPAATELVSPITATTMLPDVVSDPLCPDYVANRRVAVMASLTISPGVFIEFAPRTGIDVAASAALIARGTSAAPILLRGEDWDGIAVRSDDVLNELDYGLRHGGERERRPLRCGGVRRSRRGVGSAPQRHSRLGHHRAVAAERRG